MRALACEVELAGDLAVVQGEDGLDQTRDTGGGFQVSEVRLGGADQQGLVRGTAPPEYGAEGAGLDGVAEGGAGAVGLDVVDGREAGDVRGVPGALR